MHRDRENSRIDNILRTKKIHVLMDIIYEELPRQNNRLSHLNSSAEICLRAYCAYNV